MIVNAEIKFWNKNPKLNETKLSRERNRFTKLDEEQS